MKPSALARDLNLAPDPLIDDPSVPNTVSDTPNPLGVLGTGPTLIASAEGTAPTRPELIAGRMRPTPGEPGEMDPNYREQRTQAEIERLYPEEKVKRQVREQSPQLQRQVQQQSLTLLEQNKQRLNTEQQKYTTNSNPNSGVWKSLWGAAQQRQDLQAQAKDLKAQQAQMSGAHMKLFGLPQGSPQWKKQSDFIKQREAFLNNSIALNRQAQTNLQYAFPALAAVQDKDWQNRDLRAVQQRLLGEFNHIRGSIDGMSGELRRDASLGVMFDASVERYLAGVKDPKLKQGLHEWVEQQQLNRRLPAQLSGASSGALFLAAFFPPLASVAGGLRVAAGIGGVAAAGSEIPDLVRMDMAAQAGRGGVPGSGQLTSQSTDEARLNLVGGWTNVVMAGIDVGLETKAIQALARGTSRLGASGVRIGRDGWQRILKAKQQGGKQLAQVLDELKLPKAQREQLELAVEKVPNGAMDPKQPLRSQGSATGSGVAVPTAIRGYQNAGDVAPLLGRRFVPGSTPLPPGYKYAQIPDGNGNFRKVIYMPESNARSVPLKVDENGLIQVGPKGGYRVARKEAYDANFETIPGQKGVKVFQGNKASWVHHLVADNVMRKNPVYQRAFELGLMNPDRTSNLIELAKDANVLAQGRQSLRNQGLSENLVSDVTHYTQHPNYDQLVTNRLNESLDTLKEQRGLGHLTREQFANQMKRTEIESFIRNTENRLRRGYMGTDQRLYRQLPRRPNGSISQNPENSSSELA
jgi:A nuclease family of the HNH/ENDO VII superfamily with conserved AHH